MDWGFPLNIPESRLLRLLLLLLILVMAVRCEGCQVDKCTREYEWAMDQKEILSREASVEYCEIVRDYGACLKRIARYCRGNLVYHSTVSTVKRLYREFNCPELLMNVSSAGHTPPPSSSVAPLPHPSTTVPSRLHCSFEGKRRFRHCGLFGDPHLKTFNNEYQTCRVRGAWPLIDNPYLAVQVTNEPVAEGSPATVTTKVTIIIRGRKTNCTQEKTYEATAEAVLPATFIDGTQRSGLDDSVVLTEYEPQHVEIHLRYIETTLIIRQTGTYLAFSVRMPEEIVDFEGSDGDSLQLCVRGCPIKERLDPIAERGHKMPWDKAVERCRRSDSNEVTNNLTDHYLDWCVFDVMTTGDANYFTAAAHSAQADVLRLDPASLKNKTMTRSTHELSASVAAVSPSAVMVVLVLLVTALLRTP